MKVYRTSSLADASHKNGAGDIELAECLTTMHGALYKWSSGIFKQSQHLGIKTLMTTEAMGNWIKYLSSFFRSCWLLTFGML